MSFERAHIITAKGPRVCCECKGKIASGERYQAIYGKSQKEKGNFDYRTCLPCVELRNRIANEPYYGELLNPKMINVVEMAV